MQASDLSIYGFSHRNIHIIYNPLGYVSIIRMKKMFQICHINSIMRSFHKEEIFIIEECEKKRKVHQHIIKGSKNCEMRLVRSKMSSSCEIVLHPASLFVLQRRFCATMERNDMFLKIMARRKMANKAGSEMPQQRKANMPWTHLIFLSSFSHISDKRTWTMLS